METMASIAAASIIISIVAETTKSSIQDFLTCFLWHSLRFFLRKRTCNSDGLFPFCSFRFHNKGMHRNVHRRASLQEIIIFCLVLGGSFLVFLHLALHTLEKLCWNDIGDFVWNKNISVNILTNIAEVIQKMLNAVVCKRISASIFHPLLIEPIADSRHRRALIISLENIQNKLLGYRVNLKILFLHQ